MPLPTAGGAGQAAVPPSSGVVRRHSMELELPLPSQAEPPVAYVPPSLEMSLPFESTPQSSTRSLEANLPSIEAPAPQRAPDPPPPRAPAQSGSMEELLRPPPPRTPEPSASPALVLDVQMPQRKPSDPGLELAGRALGGGEFDVSMPPRGAVATPPIYAAPPPRIAARAQPIEVRPTRGVGERLRAPLRVLLVALVVAGADIGWLRITGERLMFGPIRPFWVAAPLALFGVGFTLWRMMEDHGD